MSSDYHRLIEGYRALGLEVGASGRSVKAAYRNLIKEWHPDVHGSAAWSEEKAKEINSAFSRLKSLSAEDLKGLRIFYRSSKRPKRTTIKPRYRPTPAQKSPRRARRRQEPGKEIRPTFTPTASPFHRRGRDAIGEVTLSPWEESFGARWKLSVPTCHTCGGWGAAIDTELLVCEDCRGLGVRVRSSPTSICTRCQGAGSHYDLACHTCKGYSDSTFFCAKFHVPPGTGRNFSGLVEGLGHRGIGGGAPGDLYLIVL